MAIDSQIDTQTAAPPQPEPDTGSQDDTDAQAQSIAQEFMQSHPEASQPASTFQQYRPQQDYEFDSVDPNDPASVDAWHSDQMKKAQDRGEITPPSTGGGGASAATDQQPAAPSMPGGNYGPQVERWRMLAAATMPESLRNRPDKYKLLDKFMYTMKGESGGNPTAVHDGGAGYGLMADRINRTPYGSDPITQLKNAWKLVENNPDKWTDWGEGATYQGKSFGALGRNPYQGFTDQGTTSGDTGNTTELHLNTGGIIPNLNITIDPKSIHMAQQQALDSINKITDKPITDNPALAVLLDEATNKLDDPTKKAALQNFADSLATNSYTDHDGNKVEFTNPSDQLNYAWNNMVATIKDAAGNADPNVLQLANVAAAIGSAGIGEAVFGGGSLLPSIEGIGERAVPSLTRSALATVGLGGGQAVEQNLPENTPDWVREFATTFANTLPFTIGAGGLSPAGVLRGTAIAGGGAAASEAYSQGNLPDFVNVPGNLTNHPTFLSLSS